MALLQEKEIEQIKKMFEEIKDNVTLSCFIKDIECQYCGDTRQILEEVSQISDKITLNIYNFETDKDAVKKYGIDKVPATVVEGRRDFGIRFYGIPSGYEFSSLLEDIVDVSKGQSGLLEESKALLKEIDAPLHLQVFITPTCPHCPKAVRLAHKMAIENELISAEMVEATEFPQLSMKYNVRGVPRTMLSGDFPIEGALPESAFVERVVGSFKQMHK